ncbi:hypothetical protein KJ819_02210 [Patescibacteria group bacterium]|nr:hypothetical protein [Patescibacteria group bacterium]MBU1500902.1 hypothetical protein [Patescibacteria group bacterium]MBU2080957.1 hypothetical protein [Patescibacteria group bacterium]MBU2124062.1 hypothetical protein [Patescibacteria group bacterium]MBU2194647.1 hypothetical protein [Patescibacteria group bacterium]
MKTTSILLGIALLLIAVFVFTYSPKEEEIKDTAPVVTERYMDIESYVKTSISELSPTKEQVGGTFFVTKIETSGGTGVVEYEDGHNAYTADFTYTISEEGKSEITSFIVR